MHSASSSRSSLPATLGLAALGLLSLGLAAVPAQAQTQTTINFDSFTQQAQATSNGQYAAGPSYSAQGFTFTTPYEFTAVAGNSNFGDGETSLSPNRGGLVTLTQTNGGAFSFNAIDLGPIAGNTSNSYAGPTLFTGTRADKSTATQTVTTKGTFQTFNFTNFTNLTSLTFAPSGNSIPLFDNVVLTPNGVAPVPEASTTVSLGLLLALGMGGMVVAARKKRRA